MNNEAHGFKKSTGARSKVNILYYIKELADRCLERSGNKRSDYHTLLSLNRHIELFAGFHSTLKNIDKEFVTGFASYLRTAKSFNKPKNKPAPELSQNTRHKLFTKLKYVVKQAIKDGGISTDPFLLLDTADKPKAEESKREYLTIEEIKQLMKADCKNFQLKQAFLFCSLTGLRYSDIKKTVWGDLHTDNEGKTELQFKQQKTKGLMYLQVSDEATKWLPDRNGANDTDVIFHLPKNDQANKQLSRWIKKVGINKKITFHCSRHTAATLNLTLGTPIETVSKLMGHSKISTTQVYAKIVNAARRAAVDRQNGIFD